MDGGSNMMLLRDARLPDVATATQNARGGGDTGEFVTLARAVSVDAMHRLASITFPLSVAQVLLSSLLIIASGLAMRSQRGARGLALQALLANLLLAGVAYVLTSGVRTSYIEALVSAAETLPADVPLRVLFGSRETLWWLSRFEFFVIDVGSLAVCALALTRARTKMHFDAVAQSGSAEEEP
jgi:hypothetical protein